MVHDKFVLNGLGSSGPPPYRDLPLLAANIAALRGAATDVRYNLVVVATKDPGDGVKIGNGDQVGQLPSMRSFVEVNQIWFETLG